MKFRKKVVKTLVPMICIISITTGCNSASAIDKSIEKSKLIVMKDKPLDMLIEQDEELQQQLIEEIRSIFGIGEEYSSAKFYVSEGSKENYYSVTFKKSEKDDASLDISINKDRTISKYYNSYVMNHIDNVEANKDEIKSEDAIKNFEKYIERVSPGILKKIEIDEIKEINQDHIDISYIRKEDNIPFYENGMYVTLNSYTGDIGMIQIGPTMKDLIGMVKSSDKDMVLPNKSNILSEDEAKKIFKDNVDLQLLYELDYKTQNPYLSYSIKDPSKLIDAKTKETLDYYTKNKNRNFSTGKAYFYKEPSTQKEKYSMISEKEAEKIARDFVNIDKNYRIYGAYLLYQEHNASNHVLELRFRNVENKNDYVLDHIDVRIDLKTKEVKSFNKRKYETKREEKYQKKDMLKIASDFIKKVHPNKFEKISYIEEFDRVLDNGIHEFAFGRKENDVYFAENGFNIRVDPETGDIETFVYDWDDIGQFPDKQNVITKEEAYEALLNNYDFDLRYILRENDKDKQDVVKLVYCIDFDKKISINAITNEIINEK
ncbi:hypothetical protein Curi_c21420 [Gottschalkia acidurici 9a]|uniref:YcdB/YcdC repeated domain-containing protein n=1 Tax=Gottschalkia acidurici (strain ATCC 7906 / DSM 604 / BCRC 14475 / CIP 104303 / KCTC 5404 / NCIMB 10678 / 9a) TaxID=1128398 RepID=K0B2I3_GOTA9|nr:YcdB/YcdC domain-containing protein [Gottschalkia acidurici]AFS79145.1 hypothetical protein Curi_c21420 [Gottschalkia acidurici 9a]